MVTRVILLLGTLIAVIYAMSFFKSEEGQGSATNFLGVLTGSSAKPFNWCGPSPQRLEVSGQQIDQREFPLYCEALIETVFSNPPAEDFAPVAHSEEGDKKRVLEMNSEGVFRVEGLPFRSLDLTKRIKAQGPSQP